VLAAETCEAIDAQQTFPRLTGRRCTAGPPEWILKRLNSTALVAMVQTLSRDNHVRAMPTLDLLVIDEAHHAASAT
jgi:superfamily II DNA or RNA helicase